MLSDAKKKAVSIIVKKAKGPTNMENMQPEYKEPEMENGVEQDQSVPEMAAAEELLSAIESKSPAAIVEALKALMELCEKD